MVQEGALTALASVADSSQVLETTDYIVHFTFFFHIDFFFMSHLCRSTSKSIMMLSCLI